MCDDREKLIAYLYDEVDASDRRLMDAHLATCVECRDELKSLRSVRQDLLAWDVPEHGSVWKPFATPVVAPWWKQVPAWGLAAAATVMFGIGLAGGFAARALMPAPATAVASLPPQTAPVVSATAEDVQQLRDRLASIEKVALTRPAAAPADSVTLTRAEVQQLLRDTEGRVTKSTSLMLLRSIGEMNKQRDRDMATITQQINEAQSFNARSLVTAMNRTEKEK